MLIEKIVSGGQTGVDQAALDWAIDRGIEHGGWCPKNRHCEDGEIPERFVLEETPSEGFAQRTEWNVRDSDATLIVSPNPQLSGGTLLTLELTKKWKRPSLVISRASENPGEEICDFVDQYFVRILNIAGPRGSHEIGVNRFTQEVLDLAWGNG